MKIYLSDYWKKQIIFAFVIIAILILLLIKFCVFDFEFSEDIFLVACGTWFILAFSVLSLISLPLVNYIIVDKDKRKVKMYSFCGKELSSIDIDSQCDIYYEVISLRENTMSFNDYMILSNTPFTYYSDEKKKGLSDICKKVITSGSQIIVSESVGKNILNLQNSNE